MDSNVVDIKTGDVIFSQPLKNKLQEGLKPYVKEGSAEDTLAKAVESMEQIICTSMVLAARNVGTKLVNKLCKFIEEKAPTE